MQDVTVASFIGIANGGNDGASGGGGCGGIAGGASTDAKATGGIPLLVSTRTGYAGGDGFANSTTAGGGGGYGGVGKDNTVSDAGLYGKGGPGTFVGIETTTTIEYCKGGNGGTLVTTATVPPLVNNTTFGSGGTGASNKAASATLSTYNGGDGMNGVIYISFNGAGITKDKIIVNNNLSTIALDGAGANTGYSFMTGISNENSASSHDTLIKLYIPSSNYSSSLDYLITFTGLTTATTGISGCVMYLIGGGGGGGGCMDGSRTGGGGGAGQYIKVTSFKIDTNVTQYFTIGAGGKGGIANKNGNDGFNTTASINSNSLANGCTAQSYVSYGGGGGAGGGVTNSSKNEELIKKLIRKIYVADVEAIRNLSIYASKLISTGLQIDGVLSIADKTIMSGTAVGIPQSFVGTAAAPVTGLANGSDGTKLVLKKGITGPAGGPIATGSYHPYALGVTDNEMWYSVPFNNGGVLTLNAATGAYTAGTAPTTTPISHDYVLTPNKYNWYSGDKTILTLDCNGNLILGKEIGFTLGLSNPVNTLYTVKLNIGTQAAGSLLSFSNSSLNISTNLKCGAITSSGALALGTNTITCGAITSSGALALGTNTITCGAITSAGLLTLNNNINLNNENCIQFGADQAKGDGAAGQIRYSTYQNGSLCIVGTTTRGNTGGTRKITMWDNVEVTSNLSCGSVNTGGTVNCGSVNTGGRVQSGDVNTTNVYCTTINCGTVNTSGSIACNYNISSNVSYCNALKIGIWTIQQTSHRWGGNALGFHNTAIGNYAFSFAQSGDLWGVIGGDGVDSDIRIKNNTVNINNNLINKLLLLKPKEYDITIHKNKEKKYGFIAQEVKNILPNIINIEENFISNIYSYANYDNNIITINNIDITNILKVDDTIKIILDKDKDDKCVIVNGENHKKYNFIYAKITDIISSNKFKIDKEFNCKQIFIYGTLVDDFHTLDYNSIFTLNVAATQELYKEHTQLKDEHTQLKDDYTQLKADHSKLYQEHEQLKKEQKQLKMNLNELYNMFCEFKQKSS